jgi:hypothetical protein
LNQEFWDPYDYETHDLIVAILILKNSNHDRTRDQLQQQFALGTLTEDTYPNTEDKAIALIDSIDRNSNGNDNNNNNNDDGAVVAAHYIFPEKYNDTTLVLQENDQCYEVPTSCPNKRYNAPCGLGSTMLANRVVLTYPDVNQYLVEPTEQAPQRSEICFLCSCSSSTFAALKGLVRYTCSGTLCRCYNMGVDVVLQTICDRLNTEQCSCSDRIHTISIAGIQHSICLSCIDVIKSILYSATLKSQHIQTLHDSTVDCHHTLSLCTGTLMRRTDKGRWISSLEVPDEILDYASVLSPCASLVSFPANINVTRL